MFERLDRGYREESWVNCLLPEDWPSELELFGDRHKSGNAGYGGKASAQGSRESWVAYVEVEIQFKKIHPQLS